MQVGAEKSVKWVFFSASSKINWMRKHSNTFHRLNFRRKERFFLMPLTMYAIRNNSKISKYTLKYVFVNRDDPLGGVLECKLLIVDLLHTLLCKLHRSGITPWHFLWCSICANQKYDANHRPKSQNTSVCHIQRWCHGQVIKVLGLVSRSAPTYPADLNRFSTAFTFWLATQHSHYY